MNKASFFFSFFWEGGGGGGGRGHLAITFDRSRYQQIRNYQMEQFVITPPFQIAHQQVVGLKITRMVSKQLQQNHVDLH